MVIGRQVGSPITNVLRTSAKCHPHGRAQRAPMEIWSQCWYTPRQLSGFCGYFDNEDGCEDGDEGGDDVDMCESVKGGLRTRGPAQS